MGAMASVVSLSMARMKQIQVLLMAATRPLKSISTPSPQRLLLLCKLQRTLLL